MGFLGREVGRIMEHYHCERAFTWFVCLGMILLDLLEELRAIMGTLGELWWCLHLAVMGSTRPYDFSDFVQKAT